MEGPSIRRGRGGGRGRPPPRGTRPICAGRARTVPDFFWRRTARTSRNGRNVVLHEFAHKLDMLDGAADGTPQLGSPEQYTAWHRIMTEEYEHLVEDAERDRSTLLDTYGATNAAEFFAVATECFFEKPTQMRKRHCELYGLLRSYYRQDPATRGSASR